MELVIRTHREPGPAARRVEVVERKGIGHPDTICDALAEEVSRALCRHYQEVFGTLLHHNVDKVLLVGGQARASFGGGEMTQPIEIYLAGRASGWDRIPVDEVAVEAARGWLRTHIRHLDPDRNVRIIPRIRPGSSDLTGLFARQPGVPLSNDTSCGVGFAPPTELERVVLAVERALNADDTKRLHPEIGEDVKVMAARLDEEISLTVGCAFVARHISGLEAYRAAKIAARDVAARAARDISGRDISIAVNAADDLERGEVFLTVTGTSAEAGDDGEVGRGNRANGLITPGRPMTMEAVAGKNPVTHVGKLYNLLADRVATALAADIPGVRDVTCLLLSRIGRPVADPQLAEVALALDEDAAPDETRARVEAVLRDHLARIDQLRSELLQGRIGVY